MSGRGSGWRYRWETKNTTDDYHTIAIRHSPFAIRHSPFAIRHSPFAIRHSPFAIGIVKGS